ncbi:hypothetical protein [Actinomadura alba]|uniref:Uncharacterized protein n=1 Tax=Actinomadura alba TaxID=406431 RepID=A0ABR7LHD4_9ACTN|nr:hypothetical protein [Actinomadura alba]MBC6464269.1 hypothetical protein [Actinomadura alba]
MAEALDWLEYWAGRAFCRVLHRHNTSCRGRRDHMPHHVPGPTGCGHWL